MVVHPSFQQPSLNYCMVTTRALHLTLKSLYKCYQTLQVRNETLQKMVTAVFECDRQHCSISFGEEMLQTFQHQSVFLSWSNAHGHFTRKKAAAGVSENMVFPQTWASCFYQSLFVGSSGEKVSSFCNVFGRKTTSVQIKVDLPIDAFS